MTTLTRSDPGLFEVDEPTQPFTRAEINRLSQKSRMTPGPHAKAPVPVSASGNPVERGEDDHEWFELEGRWLRVSLAAFDHIGFSGAPPGMLGAADAAFMCGTIVDGQGFMTASAYAVATPAATEADISAELAIYSRPRWRQWAVFFGVIVVVTFVMWIYVGQHIDAAEPIGHSRRTSTPVSRASNDGRSPERPVGIVLPVDARPIAMEPEPLPKRRSDWETRACVDHRRRAEETRRVGNWKSLEQLARKHTCWKRACEAKALRMQSLFELERFHECVSVGTKCSSKEAEKWASICQRALAR